MVLPRPHIKVLEIGIELDVLKEELDAFWERGLDAVHHLLEGISAITIQLGPGLGPDCLENRAIVPKVHFIFQGILVALLALFLPKPEVVCLTFA